MKAPALFDGEVSDEAPALVSSSEQTVLGRYRLRYQLASGGMATVYLGYATGAAGFARAVAIKRIHPHLASRRAFVEMFFDEARIASRIHHPNVCSVVDFGEADGSYFIAMELLDGESLASVLRRMSQDDAPGVDAGPWWSIAAYVIACACEGLHAAHELRDERGHPLDVVHRDVSPHNVFVTYDGGVKVVDFGVARARDRIHETTTGTIKGKLAYMAPEHASGQDVDRRADVWSLGVCLWEMLTGERLFRRKNEMETLLAIRSEAIRAPSRVRRSAPVELDAIVLRALERDPKKRHPTARAMGRELQSFLRTRAGFAGPSDVEEWMHSHFGQEPTARRALFAEVERTAAAEHTASLPEEASDVHAVRPPPTPMAARKARVESAPERRGERQGAGTRSLPAPDAEEPEVETAVSVALPAATVVRSEPTERVRRRSKTALVAFLAAGGFALVAAGAAVGVWIGGAPSGDVPQRDNRASADPWVPGRTANTEPVVAREPAIGIEPPIAPSTVGTAPAIALPAIAPEPAIAPPERSVGRVEESPTPRRPIPTSAAEEGFGTVNVVVIDGWAQVFHAGRDLGRTPRQVRLRAGRQTIELRPFGRAPAMRRTVRVERDGVVRVAVRLGESP